MKEVIDRLKAKALMVKGERYVMGVIRWAHIGVTPSLGIN